MKSILFENSKILKNKHIYFGDWCLDDQKLDKNSFQNSKKLSMNIIGIVIEN